MAQQGYAAEPAQVAGIRGETGRSHFGWTSCWNRERKKKKKKHWQKRPFKVCFNTDGVRSASRGYLSKLLNY